MLQTDKTIERKNALGQTSDLRILYVAPRECWPLDSGAKLRNYHLAREIARRARVTYLAFAEQQSSAGEIGSSVMKHQNHVAEFLSARPEEIYDEVITLPRDKSYTFSKIVRGSVGRTPLTVLNYTTPVMSKELVRLLDQTHFDVVQFEGIHLAAYAPIIMAARKRPLLINDWHNIESELAKRYSEKEPNLLRKFYARRTAMQLSATERNALREFDAHVVVSERERQTLLEVAPQARIFVVDNGVETDFYTDRQIEEAYARWLISRQNAVATISPSASARRHRIVFVGSMDYHANVEAVVYFVNEIWPRILQRMPQLGLTIVGRHPTAEVQRLAAVTGVEVTGTVDDVRPYYRESLASIVPLRVGGGSRLKILEAMAAGVPVISTRLGAEGLDVKDGVNIVLAETAEEFCRSAVALADEHEERWRQLSDSGRAFVRERYDWARCGEALLDVYQTLMMTRRSEA